MTQSTSFPSVARASRRAASTFVSMFGRRCRDESRHSTPGGARHIGQKANANLTGAGILRDIRAPSTLSVRVTTGQFAQDTKNIVPSVPGLPELADIRGGIFHVLAILPHPAERMVRKLFLRCGNIFGRLDVVFSGYILFYDEQQGCRFSEPFFSLSGLRFSAASLCWIILRQPFHSLRPGWGVSGYAFVRHGIRGLPTMIGAPFVFHPFLMAAIYISCSARHGCI